MTFVIVYLCILCFLHVFSAGFAVASEPQKLSEVFFGLAFAAIDACAICLLLGG